MSVPNLPGPEEGQSTTARPAASSSSWRRAGVFLAIAGAVVVLLLCAVGLVFLSNQALSMVGLAGKANTPVASARNSPTAIASKNAEVKIGTPAPTVPGSGSTTPVQSVGSPTAPLTATIPVQPGATQANPLATTARSSPRPTTPTIAPPLAASPSPKVAPGVYVTGMRIEPTQVMNGQNPKFYVTFLNSHATPITYTWFIKVFEPDKKQSFGEEAKVGNVLPPGSSTWASASNWKAPGEQPCRPFIARVFYYMAQDNAVVEFSTPEGNSWSIDFKVCQ